MRSLVDREYWMRQVLRQVEEPELNNLWLLFHITKKTCKVFEVMAYSGGSLTYEDLKKRTGYKRSALRRILKSGRESRLVASSSDIPRDEYPLLHRELFGEQRQEGAGRPQERFIFIPSLEGKLMEEVLSILEKRRKKDEYNFETRRREGM